MCTFASKALRANAAGAAAAVIVQTHDVWPYVMEDSKGEAKAGGGLDIPVCMVSKEKGEFREGGKEGCQEEETRAQLPLIPQGIYYNVGYPRFGPRRVFLEGKGGRD